MTEPDVAVFVPAIMSVGLLVSIGTLLRDALHWTGARTRRRRTAIEAGGTVSALVGERPTPADLGMLSRPSYLVSAIALVGGAGYVAIGSIANFVRDGGYLRDISWLLAVSLVLAVLLGFLGGVSLVVYRSWPHPPSWTYGPLRASPLSMMPGAAGSGPSWALTVAVWASALATLILSLIVGTGRSVVFEIDQPIFDWLVEIDGLDRLAAVDPFGSTVISIAFVALIGLAGFRCRLMAIAYPAAFVASWVLGEVLRDLIERPRPVGGGDFESFPSGHIVQAVFVAGLLPLAIRVLAADRSIAGFARFVLALAVVATGLHRVHDQHHWPLDVVGGVTFGLIFVLLTHWILDHRSWHRSCASCPWSENPSDTPWEHGVIRISPQRARILGWTGVGLGLLSSIGLVTLSFFVGLPVDPEGYGLGSAITEPVQLALAGLLALGAVASIWWPGFGAFVMAVSASGIGLFASVQYPPLTAVVLTCVLLVAPVVTWFGWQPEETVGRIATLAVITTSVLVVTTIGSREIYAHYFGPTHPESTAAEPTWEEADWFWLGGVTSASATVVAGGLDSNEEFVLAVDDSKGAAGRVRVRSDDDGVARFELSGLDPAMRYHYRVVEADDDASLAVDPDDADGQFETPAEGPQDLTIVASSCARTASNGSVFDAMLAEQPDLYLALGDLHYSNLASDDPTQHLSQYATALSQPGQAALFSSIPTAYVWDDHDYGPNDADGTSVSRLAVSTAYRQAVPHHGVDPDPDQSIAQAFSLGRVRVVITDTRSQRTDTTMLGSEQLAWLIDELTQSSSNHALVIWANPTPWLSESGADDWSRYPGERRAISEAMVEAGIENVVMVSGDAHMVAIDDGTNTGYAEGGQGGFPLLHAAALDRPGSVKGGPYSHGTFPGFGQFGRVSLLDDGGDTVSVTLSGHTWEGVELVSHQFEIEVPEGAQLG